jgi:hypothetical protein
MEIKKICVLGAGLMGAGIAQVAAEAGYDVALRDIEERFVQGGLNTIQKNYERAIGKGEMTKGAGLPFRVSPINFPSLPWRHRRPHPGLGSTTITSLPAI